MARRPDQPEPASSLLQPAPYSTTSVGRRLNTRIQSVWLECSLRDFYVTHTTQIWCCPNHRNMEAHRAEDAGIPLPKSRPNQKTGRRVLRVGCGTRTTQGRANRQPLQRPWEGARRRLLQGVLQPLAAFSRWFGSFSRHPRWWWMLGPTSCAPSPGSRRTAQTAS